MAQANVKAVITAEDRASGTLQNFGNKASTMGDRVARSLKVMAVAAAAATAVFAKFSIDQFRDIQNNVAGIQALTKNTKEAKRVLKGAIDFVQGKPFDRLDTIRASKQLLAFGRDSKKVNDDLRVLGNTVILTGGEWENLTRVYGRVFAQNRLMNDDFQILTDAGVGLGRVLMKNLGVSMADLRDKMAEGEVTFKDFKKAMEEAAPDKAVQNALNTFDNRLLSLKASFRDVAFAILGVDFNQMEEGMSPLVKPGGLLDLMMKGMVLVTSFLRKDFIPNLSNIGTSIGSNLVPKLQVLKRTFVDDLFPALQNFWNNALKPITREIGSVMVSAIGFLLDAFNGLIAGLSPVIDWLGRNTEVTKALTRAILILYGTFKAVEAISSFVDALNVASSAMRLYIAKAGTATTATRILGVALASPFTLTILVGGALWALNQVWQAVQSIKGAINELDNLRNAQVSSGLSESNAIQGMQRLLKSGTPAQKKRAKNFFAKKAAGFAEGGFTGRGGTSEFAGVVHKGEYVLPKQMVDQNTGTPKVGSSPTINININAGAYMGSRQEARRYAEQIANALKDTALMKGQSVTQVLS